MQREPSSMLGTCVGHAGLQQHTQLISHCSQLLYCSRFWDVAFTCQNGELVHANRAFLAARSEFFRGLLFGGLQESHLAEIALPKVKAAPLRLVLHFLHTLEVKSTDATEMMEACELARQYNISECENSLLQQLRDQTVLNGNAISVILDKASSLSMPQLELLALEKCSSMLITPSAFLGFSPSALHLCLSAAHLKASETSVLEAVIRWGKSQLCNNPNLALKWVLADILPKLRLESIPADTLQQLVRGLDLLSPEDIAAVRFSQTVQEQPGLRRQYVRRPWGELGPDIACTDIDIIEFKSQQHQGARSRHCLKAGTGCYVWHLSVERYSSCTWIGLVDDTADMSRWLGNQTGCWMMGSNGSIAAAAPRCDCCADEFGCPLSPAEKVLYGNQSYHVVPYGAKYDADGTRVTVHIDMTARQCSFEVDGTHFGVAFWNLPAEVYPAVSMRYGGKVKFITCMGVN